MNPNVLLNLVQSESPKFYKMKNTGKGIPPVVHKNNPKVVSVIAYLTFVGWLIAFLLNSPKSELSSFHIRQALGVHLIFLVSSMLMWIPIVGWLAGIVGFLLGVALWFIGIVAASKEEEDVVPIFGNDFQKWFAGL